MDRLITNTRILLLYLKGYSQLWGSRDTLYPSMLCLIFLKVLQSCFCHLAGMEPFSISSVYATARIIRQWIKQGRFPSTTLQKFCTVACRPCSLKPETFYYIGGCGIRFYPGRQHEDLTHTQHESWAFQEVHKLSFSVPSHFMPSQLNPCRILFFTEGFLLFLRGKLFKWKVMLCIYTRGVIKSKICIWAGFLNIFLDYIWVRNISYSCLLCLYILINIDFSLQNCLCSSKKKKKRKKQATWVKT